MLQNLSIIHYQWEGDHSFLEIPSPEMFFSHTHIFLAIPYRPWFLLNPGVQKLLYLLNYFLGYTTISAKWEDEKNRL